MMNEEQGTSAELVRKRTLQLGDGQLARAQHPSHLRTERKVRDGMGKPHTVAITDSEGKIQRINRRAIHHGETMSASVRFHAARVTFIGIRQIEFLGVLADRG